MGNFSWANTLDKWHYICTFNSHAILVLPHGHYKTIFLDTKYMLVTKYAFNDLYLSIQDTWSQNKFKDIEYTLYCIIGHDQFVLFKVCHTLRIIFPYAFVVS